jgi:nucleoside-diphosphate-sugar epimerase
MSKRLLITGASGFIGGYVAKEALRRGYRVTGLDRRGSGTGGVEAIRADIRDREHMMRVVKDQDCVIHLAAVTSNVEFIKNPAECYDVNANGFLNIIEAAAQSGCERFVYASSAAVYLDGFSEDTVIDIARQGNHYAKTKIMNEMVARSYAQIRRMRTIGLRFFNVYGNGENAKGDYASIVTIFLKAKSKGEPLVVYGDGRQARDLIHVTDAATLTMDLLEQGDAEIYNVGTGAAMSFNDIARMIDPDHIEYVPNPLTDYQYYTRADTRRLRKTLGDYRPADLPTGIGNTRV